jgi:phosphoglycolate phosphatase
MSELYTKNWILKDIKTILFDKDGTIIDAHTYWGRIIILRIRAVMKKYDIPEDAFENLCLALGYNQKSGKLIPEGPIALLPREEVINSLLEALRSYKIVSDFDAIADIFKEIHKEFLKEIYDYIKLIDGVKDFFIKLKNQGVQLAVITSDMYDNTIEILKYLDIEQYFDLVIGKDNCFKAKETGEPALIALEKLGANSLTTISVGDAQMDYLMAKNANLQGTILVATGQVPIGELRKHSDFVVNDLKEVQVKQ